MYKLDKVFGGRVLDRSGVVHRQHVSAHDLRGNCLKENTTDCERSLEDGRYLTITVNFNFCVSLLEVGRVLSDL